MKKIPTLLVRNPDNRREVLPELAVDLRGADLIAVPKWDGTCVMYDGSKWWGRREVKPGAEAPPDFQAVDHDEVTGKTVGWVPITYTENYKWHNAAIQDFKSYVDKLQRADKPDARFTGGPVLVPGTYEAMGQHFNGDPHKIGFDTLQPHGWAQLGKPEKFDFVKDWFFDNNSKVEYDTLWSDLNQCQYEGFVLYDLNTGLPVAKIKRRDVGLDWPKEVQQ